MKRRMLSLCLAAAVLLSQIPFAAFALTEYGENFEGYEGTTSVTASTTPWSTYTFAPATDFSAAITTFDGDMAMEVKQGATVSATSHQGVFRTFSDTPISGIIEYENKIYVPSTVDTGSGVKYNSNRTIIYLNLFDSYDTVSYQIVKNGNVMNVSDVADNEAVTLLGTIPYDTWVTFKTTLDSSKMEYWTEISYGDTVIGGRSTEAVCRNYTSRGVTAPESVRYFIQRGQPNQLFYVDDIKFNVLSWADAAEADKAALTVANTVWSEDQTLSTAGSVYDSAISWASSNETLLAVDASGNAVVTRPAIDTDVTLTATVSKGDASVTKKFTVTLKGIAEGVTRYSENFESYEEDVSLNAGTTPWSAAVFTDFTPQIGTFAGSRAMKLEIGSTAPTAHLRVNRIFSPEQISGVLEYEMKVYVPSSASAGVCAWLNLTDTKTDGSIYYDVVSYRLQKYAGTLDEFTLYACPSWQENGAYKEGDDLIGVFPADTWVTIHTTVDSSTMQYRTTVTSGETVVKDDKSTWRNYQRGFNPEVTTPEAVSYFIQRGNVDKTVYIDDILFDVLSFKGAAQADVAAIAAPESVWLTNQVLPTVGGIYDSAITWSSSSDVITVDADGNAVINPSESDTLVTLTATAAKGGATAARELTVTVKSLEEVKKVRLTNIIEKLRFEDISGQKANYIAADFTAAIADLPSDVAAVYTSGNTAVLAVGADNVVTVSRQENDVFTTFKVSLSDGTYSAEKTFDVMVQGEGTVVTHEGFDDTSLLGKSVSNLSDWEVISENADESVTGATTTVQLSPDDEREQVMDIQKLRSYGANQYAGWSMAEAVPGQIVIEADVKFTGSKAARYILYTTGNYVNDGEVASTGLSLAQLFFDFTREGKIWAQINNGGVGVGYNCYSEKAMPMDEWFHLRVILNQAAKSADVYVDDEKYNTEPIPFYDSPDCDSTQLTNITIGASRGENVAGHFYADDMQVRALASDALMLETEKDALSITAETVFDIPLPVSAAYGSAVTWKSHNTAIIADDGKVTRASGMGADTVKLTATLKRGELAVTRDFDIKIPQQPVYTIDNVTFADGEGNLSYTPAAGRIIKSLSVTGYTGAAAEDKIYIAVYHEGELVNVRMLDAASDMSNLNIALPTEGDPDVKIFAWNGVEPMTYDFEAEAQKKEKQTSIYLCGDSTMETTGSAFGEGQESRQFGWGMLLQSLFDENYVTVKNHAKGGKSTLSFFNEGRLERVISEIKAGDYMVIQFGHNDQKDYEPHNYASLGEDGTYRQLLTQYVKAARSKGAVPVFATSIYRRGYDANGTAVDSLGGYPEEMIALAAELDVPVLDMHARSGEWLTKVGESGSAPYYMSSVNGTDNTHLTYTGALHYATVATQEMQRIGLPITAYLK